MHDGQDNHHPIGRRSLSASASTSSAKASNNYSNLQHALEAFLKPGGLFEQLGGSLEILQDKARDSLVLLGVYSFELSRESSLASESKSSKASGIPLATFEYFMRRSGFGSGVWKTREQVRSSLTSFLPPRRTQVPSV